MEKPYSFTFGSGDPRINTGLSPTLIIFQTIGGTALSAPAVSEVGSGTGFYSFTYGITAYGATVPIQFLIDGGAGLSDTDRYISGVVDPLSQVERIVGFLDDSFGSTLTDPESLTGYAKRNMEFEEGNATYNKSSTEWSIYSRGSSTLLRIKTLTNTTSQATKT